MRRTLYKDNSNSDPKVRLQPSRKKKVFYNRYLLSHQALQHCISKLTPSKRDAKSHTSFCITLKYTAALIDESGVCPLHRLPDRRANEGQR